MTEQPTRGSSPWHLWAVGIVSLLWNGMGAFDYVMTETRNEEYLSQLTEAQRQFLYEFPAWIVAAWAIAVWGGVIGAVLILLRRKAAVPVLLVSLLCVVATTVRNYGMSDGLEVMETMGLVFTIIIFAIAVGLWRYAAAMTARGVLR